MMHVVSALVLVLISHGVHGQIAELENCSSVPEESFRLYNAFDDPVTQGGMLQVCRSGVWTAVCNVGFGCANAAPPACRSLGYGGENLRVATIDARNTGSWNHTTSDYYQCSPPIPPTLRNCTRTNGTSCSSAQMSAIGVWCLTFPLAEQQCTSGAVRLVGGSTSREGRVEYCYNGAWTQICSDFGMNEVIVACRQLGFSNPPEAVVYQDADQRFGITSNFSLIQKISCSSTSASNLNMCSIQTTCATQCNTFFTNFYGIKCLGNDACVEGSVRLVNSSIALEGRVEVCHDGLWGSICGGGLTEGYVICRILGYDTAPRQYAINPQYNSEVRSFAYQITKCYGWEMNLTDCERTLQFNCSESQAVSVICRDGCADGTTRLVGGSSGREGMVEVCADQAWRAVAHSAAWGVEEAEVVCRQLSLETAGATNTSFGNANRSVLLTDVDCIGTENGLMDCSANQQSYENGSELVLMGEQVAGVSCNTQQVSLITSRVIRPSSSSMQFIATTSSTYLVATGTRTPEMVPTPSASSNQLLLEYILAALVAVFVASSILLGISLCVVIYKLKNKESVKKPNQNDIYEELDAAQYNTMSIPDGNIENNTSEHVQDLSVPMENNTAYSTILNNHAGEDNEPDPTYT